MFVVLGEWTMIVEPLGFRGPKRARKTERNYGAIGASGRGIVRFSIMQKASFVTYWNGAPPTLSSKIPVIFHADLSVQELTLL